MNLHTDIPTRGQIDRLLLAVRREDVPVGGSAAAILRYAV